MRIYSTKTRWALALLLTLSVLTLSLIAQQSTSLAIAGQPGSARLIQLGGRYYVEVEGLARLTNGSLSFSGNQIVLTLPGSAPSSNAATAPVPGFSKEFLNAAIEAVAQIREWHAALRNAIERGTPVSEDWLVTYRNQAHQAVRFASVAVNTTADKNALPFLTNELNNMNQLTDKYVQIATSRNYIPLDSLANDPLDQSVRACVRSLSSIVSTDQFVSDGSCQLPLTP
jgi:hypothetical protein